MRDDDPGRAPYWWENLLQVIPDFNWIRGCLVMNWLGGIVVLYRPKPRDDGDKSE